MTILKIETVCEKCGDRVERSLNTSTRIDCIKCGHPRVTLVSSDTSKPGIQAICVLCNKEFYFRFNQVVNGFHDAPHCKSYLMKLLPDEFSPIGMKLVEQKTEEKKPKLSVIILTHNGLETTKKCVDYVRKLNLAVFPEIILIDNGSNDKTGVWAEKQKDVVYIKNEYNLGCLLGRNQGFKWSTGDYLLFIDNDQYIPPDYVEMATAVGKDIVGAELWDVIPPDCFTKRNSIGVPSYNSYVGSGGMFLKREVFEKVGGYDERYYPAWYEDCDFCFRARAIGYSLGVILNPNVQHLGGETIKKQKSFDADDAKKSSRSLFLSIWGDNVARPNGIPRNPMHMKSPIVISKKKIAMILDVPGWAWDHKTKNIIKHLGDEFDFSVFYGTSKESIVEMDSKEKEFDLYFTFEPNFVRFVRKAGARYVTGVTAHTFVNFVDYEGIMKRAVAIHGNSKLLFNEIKKFNPNSFYLPNGVDEELFKLKKRQILPFTAGFVGKPNKRKGLEEFIKPACEKAGVNLKTLICKFNDENCLIHTQMPEWYWDIDCVVVASDMDGTPNMLLEAAAVGRTFVGNEIGNVPEFVVQGKNGFMVKRDVDEYVEKLKYLKEKRVVSAKMGVAAHKTVVKEWTWEKQAENYCKMFREILY